MRKGNADADAAQPSAVVARLRAFAVCLGLTALAFLQQPGKVVADTKIDLVVDPAGFLERATHLWDPNGSFGQIQNQAYGYFFPMGPFFLGGHLLGLPAWVVQRLWWALLLCVAFTGVVRLARGLGIGTPTSRLVAGVAFALAPRVITLLGVNSIEAWPMAVAPWVLVPLVGLAHGARIRPAVVRSAVAVGCAGAVNATAVLAILPPAVIWLAMLQPARRRLAALGAWSLAVACATVWWVVPLVIFGAYGPPLLDYTETAATTTQVTDLVTILRGASHWVAYLGTPYGPQWPAGARLVSETWLVVASLVVAGLGVVGLSRRGIPHRRFVAACLLVGVTLVGLGHVSALDQTLSGSVRDFLNGPGGPLRNVHKFDVAVRLALVLGLAHVVGVVGRWGAVVRRGFRPARIPAILVTATAAVAVAGTAAPALAGGLPAPGAFTDVPRYWHEAADWLETNATEGRILVVPGSQFPHYVWGSPGDEIAQPLLHQPWAVRNVLPMANATTIRLLDAVESALATGAGSAGLADLLARSGVAYLMVRSDLDYGRSGATSPYVVKQALQRSPGLASVASFGPVVDRDERLAPFIDHGLGGEVRALEVYRVAGPVAAIAAYDLKDVTTVVGGPESLMELAAAGQLSAAPAFLAGDLGAARPPGRVALTDGLRRREVGFGQLRDRVSATLTADEPFTLTGPAHDYLPEWGETLTTTARYEGITRVRAASSWAEPGLLYGSRPQHQPYAALDNDPTTSWRPAPGAPVAGQWIEVELEDVRTMTEVGLTFDVTAGSLPTKVTIIAGLERTTVEGFGASFTATLPGLHPTHSVRVVVDSVVSSGPGFGEFGISEIVIPGMRASRTLDLPPAPASSGPATVVLSAAPSTPACFFVDDRPHCTPSTGLGSEDGNRLDRSLSLPGPGQYGMDVWARPRPGAELNALLDERVALATPLRLGTTVIASSVAVADPAGRPGVVVDGDPATVWVASAKDPSPMVRLTFPGRRLVNGLVLALPDDVAATRPGAVRVIGDDATTGGIVGPDGLLTFDRPIRTRELTLQLLPQPATPSFNSYGNFLEPLPLGIGEVIALPSPPNPRVNPDAPITLACGTGPTVEMGGRAIRTRLTATPRDLLQQREVRAQPCGTDLPLFLYAGPQRVLATASPLSTPTRVALVPGTAAPDPTASVVRTRSWSPTERSVSVDARSTDRVLVLRENDNPGWRATVAGRELAPLVVDGWQQAWLIPAGVSGDVVLTYAPDAAYRAALIGGGTLAGALLVLMFLPARRGGAHARRTVSRPGQAPGRLVILALGFAAMVVAGGVWGALVGLVGASLAALFGRSLAGRRAVRPLELWLPVSLFALACWFWLRSETWYQDLGPQLLGLLTLVVVWMSCLAATREPARPPRQDGPFDHVVADRGQGQRSPNGYQEGAEKVTGEHGPAGDGVDRFKDERVPQEQPVRDRS